MQLIYENKFSLEEISAYHFLLIWMNYSILIKNDFVKIVPIEYKHLNLDRTILENNSWILWSFFVVVPLNGVILSRIKNYKHFILQHNKELGINELWFALKENNEYIIKEKIRWGMKLSEIKEWIDEDIYNFVKRLH